MFYIILALLFNAASASEKELIAEFLLLHETPGVPHLDKARAILCAHPTKVKKFLSLCNTEKSIDEMRIYTELTLQKKSINHPPTYLRDEIQKNCNNAQYSLPSHPAKAAQWLRKNDPLWRSVGLSWSSIREAEEALVERIYAEQILLNLDPITQTLFAEYMSQEEELNSDDINYFDRLTIQHNLSKAWFLILTSPLEAEQWLQNNHNTWRRYGYAVLSLKHTAQ